MIYSQIRKVKSRVSRWLEHPEQRNARILNLFMELSENGKYGVFRDMLEDEFYTRYPEYNEHGCNRFMEHLQQMKNFSGKNHCKVFEVDSELTVTLWWAVRNYIIGCYTI